MPITYAPPQPFAPAISQSYGDAEQSHADIPQILEARRMQLQQQAQSEANAQAANQHAAALAQQGAQFRMGQQESAYEQASNRNLDAAQFDARLQQAPALQQQHAELTAWVNNQEMTQADNMRLKKLQMALSEVMGDDTLTPQQKSDYAMHLKTGIDPLDQRLKATQQKHQEEAIANMQKEQAHKDQLWKSQQEFFAGTAGGRNGVSVLPDGRQVTIIPTPDGKFHVDVHDPKDKEAVQQKAEAELRKEWHAAHDSVVAGLRADAAKMVDDPDKTGQKKPMYPGLQGDNFWNHVNDQMQKKGFNFEVEGYVQRKMGKAGGAAPAAPGAAQTGGATTPAASGDVPVAPKPLAEQKPFEPGKPNTHEQRAAIEQFDAIKGQVDSLALPPEQKKSLRDNLDAAKHWLAMYGSPDDMPPQLQASLKGVLDVIKAAPVAPKLDPMRSRGALGPFRQ